MSTADLDRANSTAQPAIFHLSFPVTSLARSLAFYRDCLGATSGRSTDTWVDVILFGHQLTLHEQPEQVLPREQRGVRHFGAILGWDAWEQVKARALAHDPALQAAIHWRALGQPEEHVKFLLEDPDGNLVEIKAYRRLQTVSEQWRDRA
jgi:uncharacterized protein